MVSLIGEISKTKQMNKHNSTELTDAENKQVVARKERRRGRRDLNEGN